jgi:ankyrin repeat protein
MKVPTLPTISMHWLTVILVLIIFPLACVAETDETLSDQIIEAAKSGDVALVRKLLNEGAPVDARTSGPDTPLIEAAQEGHPEIVKLLLDKGANIEAGTGFCQTALILAALSLDIWR